MNCELLNLNIISSGGIEVSREGKNRIKNFIDSLFTKSEGMKDGGETFAVEILRDFNYLLRNSQKLNFQVTEFATMLSLFNPVSVLPNSLSDIN